MVMIIEIATKKTLDEVHQLIMNCEFKTAIELPRGKVLRQDWMRSTGRATSKEVPAAYFQLVNAPSEISEIQGGSETELPTRNNTNFITAILEFDQSKEDVQQIFTEDSGYPFHDLKPLKDVKPLKHATRLYVSKETVHNLQDDFATSGEFAEMKFNPSEPADKVSYVAASSASSMPKLKSYKESIPDEVIKIKYFQKITKVIEILKTERSRLKANKDMDKFNIIDEFITHVKNNYNNPSKDIGNPQDQYKRLAKDIESHLINNSAINKHQKSWAIKLAQRLLNVFMAATLVAPLIKKAVSGTYFFNLVEKPTKTKKYVTDLHEKIIKKSNKPG